MEPIAVLATCSLNQWALDFDGNLTRTKQSIEEAKRRGATYRLGPELELSGYSCEDHFLETDTVMHSWESLAELLRGDHTNGIVCDVGMPLDHKNVRYNCRVFCLDKRILLIRPKIVFADDGNYRETRWFSPWSKRELEDFVLPDMIREVTGQHTVPIGVAALQFEDTTLATESCEELWALNGPHVLHALDGVEIMTNGSGSHHQLRKLQSRLDIIKGATSKGGGVYLYSNQQGCDGGRLYFDGCALVAVNGQVVAQGNQFSVNDVEVVTAVVDLNDVRTYREEEIALGPACWLWDYLRRSGAGGYFLPLSGGADSSSVAAIVGVMCHLVCDAVRAGDEQTLADVRRVTRQDSTYTPTDPRELASRILHTCYMGTENSSAATRERARRVAEQVGAYHVTMTFDMVVASVLQVFGALFGRRPQFGSRGGTPAEDLALQNLQARLRMVLAYLFAALLPWVRGASGFLLVLGSANVDEALRGYMTKYDCSSADVNPIGGVSKGDLKRFLRWAAAKYGYSALQDVLEAVPTAELRPIVARAGEEASEEHSQTDEEDMGMTYEELGWFGRLRKIQHCGPVSMFWKLTRAWHWLRPSEVAAKVQRFFFYYSVNRHKLTTITPAYHAENYSPDDNRFDHRPFLYNVRWARQFSVMDRTAAAMDKARAEVGAGSGHTGGALAGAAEGERPPLGTLPGQLVPGGSAVAARDVSAATEEMARMELAGN